MTRIVVQGQLRPKISVTPSQLIAGFDGMHPPSQATLEAEIGRITVTSQLGQNPL
jgi:hypothetical protein